MSTGRSSYQTAFRSRCLLHQLGRNVSRIRRRNIRRCAFNADNDKSGDYRPRIVTFTAGTALEDAPRQEECHYAETEIPR